MTEATAIVLLVFSIVPFLWAVVGLINPELARTPNRLVSVLVWAVSFGMFIFGTALFPGPQQAETPVTSAIEPSATGPPMARDRRMESTPRHGRAGTPMPRFPSSPRLALIALYEATDGQNWVSNDGWLTDAPLKDWYGVEADGNVVSLDLSGSAAMVGVTIHGLAGAIPPELGGLANLQRLDLSVNGLTGPIPSELGNLTALKWLDLSDKRLTGRDTLSAMDTEAAASM